MSTEKKETLKKETLKKETLKKETLEAKLARLEAENASLKTALTVKGSGLNETVTKGIVSVLIGKKTRADFAAELRATFPQENVKSTYSGAVSHVRHAVNELIASGVSITIKDASVYDTPKDIPSVKVKS